MAPTKTGKPRGYSFAVGRNVGRVYPRETARGEKYLDGSVLTPHGIVTVQVWDGWTSLEFVHGGGYWSRCWDRTVSARWATTLAGRFAREIAQGGEK